MAITMKFNTYKVYPRVYYFRSLLLDLYKRFGNLTDCFKGDAYHNRGWLESIKNGVERYRKSPSFQIHGDSLDLERVLLYTKVREAPKEENGLQICICSLKIDCRDQIHAEQAIRDVLLPYFKTKCCKGNSLESFFVLCDVDTNVPSVFIDHLHSSIYEAMQDLHPGWTFGEKIIICSDQNDKTAATVISKSLETDIQGLFSLMLEYLQRFTGRQEGQTEEINILNNRSCVAETISRFVNDIIALNDMRKIYGIPDDEVDESTEDTVARFVKVAAQALSRNICQSLPSSLLKKYDLKPSVVDILLSEKDLYLTVSESLLNTESVLDDLKELERESKAVYIEELIESEKKKKTHRRIDSNDEMIPDILEGIKSPITDFEKGVIENLKIVLEMKRMKFEIESYMGQSSDPLLQPRKEPTLTKQFAKEIQSLNIPGHSKVRGVGIFYGSLQIHVNKDAELAPLKKEIHKVMKKHQYWYPYKVCKITKDAIPLVHSPGSTLRASWKDNYVRSGTVGAFMPCDLGNLYTITAAHVVSIGNNLADNISLITERERHRIQNPTQNATINTLIDIAAIAVGNSETHCSRHLKDMDGNNCNGTIYENSPRSAQFTTIYKHGAITGLTRGIISATQYIDLVNEEIGQTDCILICESPANAPSGHDDANFANEGDSGALICAPGIEDPDRVTVLSMLTWGKMRSNNCHFDSSTDMYFSVMLMRGLQAIEASSGLHLNLLDILPDPQLF